MPDSGTGRKQTPPIVNVALYPHLIAASLRAEREGGEAFAAETQLYFAWECLKAIDAACPVSRGGGYCLIPKIREVIEALLHVGRTRAYKLIELGTDRYWGRSGRKTGAKTSGTALLSRRAVVARLAPYTEGAYRSHLRPLGEFAHRAETWGEVKKLLVAMVFTRHDGAARPVSNESVQKLTGLSRRTVQRAKSGCVGQVGRVPNWEIVSVQANRFAALEVVQKAAGSPHKTKQYRVREHGGRFEVYKQLADSYHLADDRRGRRRGSFIPKIYASAAMNSVRYVPRPKVTVGDLAARRPGAVTLVRKGSGVRGGMPFAHFYQNRAVQVVVVTASPLARCASRTLGAMG